MRLTIVAKSTSGVPRQFIAMCENNRCSILFHLLGRKVDRDHQARPIGQTLLPLPQPEARPVAPACIPSTATGLVYAGRPMCCHQRWIDRTAKLAVS